jgi:Holliday junction DNA helicase RuvA
MMIRSLSGTVERIALTHLVLSVGGVGYLIYMNTLRYGYRVGDTVHLHTHLAVRETALDLYGFPSLQELEYFELLLEVPKIGPKSALQILGQADIAVLSEAIRAKDASLLTKLAGIGKKTAENIVQFLHDKLDHVSLPTTDNLGAAPPLDTAHSDAIDALIALGYPAADARTAVRGQNATETTELVKLALRQLSNR